MGAREQQMKKHLKEELLSPDDLECLWAIARRATIQDRLVRLRGGELKKQGLIELTHDWPTLTPKGRRVLQDLSARATLGLRSDKTFGD
jgi:hypothetical protein